MSKLKKCPFCGGEAEKFKDVAFLAENGEKIGEIKWFVWCTECSALVSGSTEQEVSDRWNRRIDNIMLICESCGAVFEYPATKMEQDTGYVEESCPECGSRYIMKAAKCKRCEEWVSEDDAFGYGDSVICDGCLQEVNSDLDLLYRATKDECEDFELPVLFRTFFTDDEIREILMRELKACHEVSRRDTKAFVRRYANEIADEMLKEDE